MYADDTHITYAGVDVNSIQLNLNHDLDNLNKWLISNKLTLNSAKSEFMLIAPDKNSRLIMFRLNRFPLSNRLEYLLMKIYGGKHIEKLSKKVASGIGAMN